MDYYTNEKSLVLAFGDAEAKGLLSDVPGTTSAARLEKAAHTAFDEINGYLRTGGYLLPLIFTPFGTEVVAPDIFVPLNGKVQEISDVFTAYYLASSEDMNKKVYEDRRAAGLDWLVAVRDGEVTLDLTLTEKLSGAGDVVVLARPAVMDVSLRSVSQISKRRGFPYDV